jgi:hypothetical protein
MEEAIWVSAYGPGGTRQHSANALRRLCRALFFVALLLGAASVLAGCGRMEKASPVTQDDYAVTFGVEPAAPTVGESELVITLKDAAGKAVSDGRLAVEANMSHAGMTPVSAAAAGGTDGVYRVPLKWTMAGDWYVDVKFTLADGQVVRRRFPVQVGAR